KILFHQLLTKKNRPPQDGLSFNWFLRKTN
ncbi:MAG: hypothetical protein ACI8VJ_000566, partial [Polaribacter sp.]